MAAVVIASHSVFSVLYVCFAALYIPVCFLFCYPFPPLLFCITRQPSSGGKANISNSIFSPGLVTHPQFAQLPRKRFSLNSKRMIIAAFWGALAAARKAWKIQALAWIRTLTSAMPVHCLSNFYLIANVLVLTLSLALFAHKSWRQKRLCEFYGAVNKLFNSCFTTIASRH